MGKMNKLLVLVIVSCFKISYGVEYDLKSITTTMDAYEKQTDCIRIKYTCKTAVVDTNGHTTGHSDFVKGTFAINKSEGYVLLHESKHRGREWDSDKAFLGHARSYNGHITRYLEYEKNRNGHFKAALYKDHNPKWYKTRENPYYRVWSVNYKIRFIDELNDPNSMATILGEEIVNGSKTVKIKFKAGGGTLDCHLWLLPEMNYLPIKYKTFHKNYEEGKRRFWEVHWGEYKELVDGIWYPMNIKMYHRHLVVPCTIQIEEIDISQLTKEDFEFAFPAFTRVTDHISGTSYVTED